MKVSSGGEAGKAEAGGVGGAGRKQGTLGRGSTVGWPVARDAVMGEVGRKVEVGLEIRQQESM